MNIAVIPWNDEFLNDRLFSTEPWKHNADNRMTPFAVMQGEFLRRGDSLHTIDLMDPDQTDWFLFFEHNERGMEWLLQLAEMGLSHRTVYCNAEPPVVNAINDPDGFRKLEQYYAYLLTWNDDWTDGTRIFRRHIPYYFSWNPGDIPFEHRELLTSISGNKHSDHPLELYSERERVITYMERNHPEGFAFYGTGWDKSVHPAYGGRVDNKNEVFHHYRFALAFENTGHVKGYITEKILDCFAAGIVPVYLGAEDIADYIPEDCFISYDRFQGPEEMVRFLENMSEERYNEYLHAAEEFWNSDRIRPFTGETYAQDIYNLVEWAKAAEESAAGKPGDLFHVTDGDRTAMRRHLRIYRWKKRAVNRVRNLLKSL